MKKKLCRIVVYLNGKASSPNPIKDEFAYLKGLLEDSACDEIS